MLAKITSILEGIFGFFMDILPIVCAVFIVTWAGRAYTEGHGLFVQKSLDKPGEAHGEMVTFSEEEAGSALTVGTILEKQNLISSRFAFVVKAKLSGYDDKLLPGTYILSSDMTMEQMMETMSVVPGTEKTGQEGEGEGQSPEAAGKDSRGSEKENKDVWGQ
ncbi:MAG: hypothetical protein Q4D81_01780 [Eubacteriales bacterium]|nr:hypothetical protein [Eubacteriales bacterium]